MHFKKTNLELSHKFNQKSKRHYLNGLCTILHCHHYTTLYTQLALDSNKTKLLTNCAEDTFYKMLSSYFIKNNITEIDEKIEIGCQYYVAIGLGKLIIDYIGDFSGKVTITHSHVDEGWIHKWGKYDKPVNYIGAGFIQALFSSILNIPSNSFNAIEIESIVMGAEKSIFNVVKL